LWMRLLGDEPILRVSGACKSHRALLCTKSCTGYPRIFLWQW